MENNSGKQQFAKAFPVSEKVTLRGVEITIALPNFQVLAELEEAFGTDWETALGKIDIKDRVSFVKLFTILVKQTMPDFTEEMAIELIDLQNMWYIADALQTVIMKSQPDPDFLMKMREKTARMENSI